jgi:hypothetical protein
VNDNAEGVAERVADVGEVTVRATVVVWVRLPEVPVTVTVEVPGVAVLLAESVNTWAVLMDAVTPVGIPDGVRATVPVNPFCGAIVMVLVPLDPWAMDKLVGDAERLKSGAAVALTISVIVVVWVRLPEVPVTVTVEVPGVAVLLAVSVRTPAELNWGVTPLGNPEAVKASVPLNPFVGWTVIVLVPLIPWLMPRVLGEAERLKSGAGAGGLTVRATVVVWLKFPDVPVTVTVEVPRVAVLLAVSVRTPAELNEAVTPVGSPEAVKATVPLNPFVGWTVIVSVPLAPCATVKEVGEAESVKSGVAAAGALIT